MFSTENIFISKYIETAYAFLKFNEDEDEDEGEDELV